MPEHGRRSTCRRSRSAGAIDIPNKKAKFSLDAPTLLGTKIDALVVDSVAYFKVAGPLAGDARRLDAGKFTKADVPDGDPASRSTDAAEIAKAIDEFKTRSTSCRRRRRRAPTRSAATRTATTSRSS